MILVQISDTVYPMYKAYIEPDLKTAHLKIYNTFNPFSGFMDPTYILKSAQRVSKETIHSLLKVSFHSRGLQTSLLANLFSVNLLSVNVLFDCLADTEQARALTVQRKVTDQMHALQLTAGVCAVCTALCAATTTVRAVSITCLRSAPPCMQRPPPSVLQHS